MVLGSGGQATNEWPFDLASFHAKVRNRQGHSSTGVPVPTAAYWDSRTPVICPAPAHSHFLPHLFTPSSHTVKPTCPFLICCNDFLLSLVMPLVAQMVKNLPAMWETWARSLGWEDSPGEGNGNPFQHPCLENSMDREAWQAIVCEVPCDSDMTESPALSFFSLVTPIHLCSVPEKYWSYVNWDLRGSLVTRGFIVKWHFLVKKRHKQDLP